MARGFGEADGVCPGRPCLITMVPPSGEGARQDQAHDRQDIDRDDSLDHGNDRFRDTVGGSDQVTLVNDRRQYQARVSPTSCRSVSSAWETNARSDAALVSNCF